MADEEVGEDEDYGLVGIDGTYLKPEERRGGPAERYTCKTDPQRNLIADMEPEAKLYCSIKKFINESKNFTDKEKEDSTETANLIVDKIIKLGPKYVNSVNGPCLIIGYKLQNSNNLRKEMKKYVSANENRAEKDIYRYVRFCRKRGI